MVSALANIVTKGNSATQSLSDAFATANHEFGMADQMIGGYQVTDEVPSSEKREEEEEESTKEVKFEEVLPEKEVDHKQIYGDINDQSTIGQTYQLSLLSYMQPVALHAKNGQVNGYNNGDLKIGHHQNGTSNGHTDNNSHGLIQDGEGNRLISVPQLEMPILHQVRSNKSKSSKRRRKAYRGPSLFD